MSNQNPTTDDRATVVLFRRRDARQVPPEPPARLWREALGDEIPRQRTRRRDRLKDTAERAGISPQYLSELERDMKDPSSEILEAVAGELGKSSFDLVRSTLAGATVTPVRPAPAPASAPASAPAPAPAPTPTNPVLLAA